MKEAASWLRISERTLNTLLAEEEITPVRIRGKRLFPISTLEAYVRDCARPRSRARSKRTA